MSNAPIAYYNDKGVAIFRASAFGRCEAAMVYSLRGLEAQAPPPDMMVRFADGHLHEPAIVEELRKRGYDIIDSTRQQEIAILISDEIIVNGHIDGVASTDGPPGPMVFDAKALADSGAKKWTAARLDRKSPEERAEWLLKENIGYAWQMSIYMHALKLPGMFAVKNKNSGQVHIFIFPVAPVPLHKIKAKAARIVRMAKAGITPECGPDRDDFLCPFRGIHPPKPGKEWSAIKTADVGLMAKPWSEIKHKWEMTPMTPERLEAELAAAEREYNETTRNTAENVTTLSPLDDLLVAYEEAGARERDGATLKAELRDKILKQMCDEDMINGETEYYRVSQEDVTTNRVDSKKLKASGIDLGPYMSASTSTRLVVKAK